MSHAWAAEMKSRLTLSRDTQAGTTGPRAVSRLYQHSPRQLRTARERLEKLESGLQPIREPANPNGIGRTRGDSEVKPPRRGHHCVRPVGVKTDLEGSGAVVSSASAKAPVPIRGACTKSSLVAVEGNFCPEQGEAQHTKRHWSSDVALHGRSGHLAGGNCVMRDTDSSGQAFRDGHEMEAARALARHAQSSVAPKSMIGGNQDFLGIGTADYKPSLRLFECPAAQMKQEERGVPAVLDKYGRPWQQKQRQHFTPDDVNSTIRQATVSQGSSSNECRRVAEAFPYEAHDEVLVKRGISVAGVHPVSEENPMHIPEAASKLCAKAGGGKAMSYLIDPFGRTANIDARASMSKHTSSTLDSEDAAPVAPWENAKNADSMVATGTAFPFGHDGGRVSALTGVWTQRKHHLTSEIPEYVRGTYAELEAKKHLEVAAPWASTDTATDSADAQVSHEFYVAGGGGFEVRKGSSTAERNMRPGAGKAVNRQEDADKPPSERSPWKSDKTHQGGFSHMQDWCSSDAELRADATRMQRRAASAVKVDTKAAGRPTNYDGALAGHIPLTDPSSATAKAQVVMSTKPRADGRSPSDRGVRMIPWSDDAPLTMQSSGVSAAAALASAAIALASGLDDGRGPSQGVPSIKAWSPEEHTIEMNTPKTTLDFTDSTPRVEIPRAGRETEIAEKNSRASGVGGGYSVPGRRGRSGTVRELAENQQAGGRASSLEPPSSRTQTGRSASQTRSSSVSRPRGSADTPSWWGGYDSASDLEDDVGRSRSATPTQRRRRQAEITRERRLQHSVERGDCEPAQAGLTPRSRKNVSSQSSSIIAWNTDSAPAAAPDTPVITLSTLIRVNVHPGDASHISDILVFAEERAKNRHVQQKLELLVH